MSDFPELAGPIFPGFPSGEPSWWGFPAARIPRFCFTACWRQSAAGNGLCYRCEPRPARGGGGRGIGPSAGSRPEAERALCLPAQDVKALARQEGVSVEVWWQRGALPLLSPCWRRGKEPSSPPIMGDDNAETMLMNLVQGHVSSQGFAAFPDRGAVSAPLLRVSREEIEQYWRGPGLAYVTDSSNLTDRYVRNRIRNR